MNWTIQQARTGYNIAHWGEGYFDINDRGHISVHPERDPGRGIDFHELAKGLSAAGLTFPVLVRFAGILHDRVRTLVDAFGSAMAEDGFQGGYTAVYPIKVNQQRAVIEEILHAGNGQVGLEAGSKPELMAVLAMAPRDGTIICNGYKDREYVRLALIGTALGHRLHIVIEKLSELRLIIEESRALGIEPLLGVRVRLASIGKGNWQNTGGEKAKFGLSSLQVLEVITRLQEAELLNSLRLVHVHLGSQIANIRDIQRGMREVARFYAELRRYGAPVESVDVGGGLGVDYEGTRSRSFYSMNYSIEEYARAIVHTLWEVCAEQQLPHPAIITESGRAMTAHHAVLVTNVIDVEQAPDGPPGAAPAADAPMLVHDLWNGLSGLYSRSALEVYHDAVHWVSEAQSMFTHGLLTLEQRAEVEQLYFAICRRVLDLLSPERRAHREVIDELHEKLADKYFCNFSLFQSLPDVWGIGQVFPIMPLHRHDQEPTRRGILQDLTCDSDGRIDAYVDREGIEASLPLHEVQAGEQYLLGFFLVGAYQEILGDMHNLFGDTDSVNVEQDPDGGYRLVGATQGDSVDELLRYVEFDPEVLMQAYRKKVAGADFSEQHRTLFLGALAAGLQGYTYLEG
ncbi:biosynthetic arginine decarboxylase [Thiohalomonas denitrificans]|uniref:biosynthetic arginine decarboxylase n=1 Tax=Thiohalomonas denitrificans TaxID=415747 RepID=UPI0026ED15D5|nr:biosynthetic arginine decarboxylase [Thiohalomonas denitrificans]